MAKLSPQTTEIINRLKQQALDVLHEAKTAEFNLLDRFGETERTAPFFDELMGVAEETRTVFLDSTRFSYGWQSLNRWLLQTYSKY